MIQEAEPAPLYQIKLQFRSKVPLSTQVRKAIFELIQSGALQEDTVLPTVRELAAQLGVNFNTVARAYRVLDKEGWLLTRQGRGTIVTRPIQQQAADPYREELSALAAYVTQVAKHLGIRPQEVLRDLEVMLSPARPSLQPHKRRQHRYSTRFRRYLPNFPRSRKTHRETLDWRRRKSNR